MCLYGSERSHHFGWDARFSVKVSRPDTPLCVPAVTMQWWCTKSWICWSKNLAAATLSWHVFLENRSPSPLGRAAAAVCVYPAFLCQGIYTTTVCILFFILTVLLLRLFPWFSVHRRMLFWLKIGSLQYAILKMVLSIFSLVLWTNGNFHPSNVRKCFNSEKWRSAIWILKHVLYSL